MNRKLGPMDTVEQIGEEIAWLQGASQTDLEPLDHADTFELLREIEAGHPLMGREVVIYGSKLTMTAHDGENIEGFAVSPEDLHGGGGPHIGTYNGYLFRRVYNHDVDDHIVAAVHVLGVGTDKYHDELGNHHAIDFLDYVLAEGSYIVPTFPINAHSMIDLADTKTIDTFDSILYDEFLSRDEKIRNIGRYANSVFERQHYAMGNNHQRVSYLNASGLLDDVRAESRTFMLADRDAMVSYSGEILISDPDKNYAAGTNLVFDLLPRYEFNEAGDHLIASGTSELHLATQTPEGEWLAMPVKDLDGITHLGAE